LEVVDLSIEYWCVGQNRRLFDIFSGSEIQGVFVAICKFRYGCYDVMGGNRKPGTCEQGGQAMVDDPPTHQQPHHTIPTFPKATVNA
jgi:hypothetical protein